MEFVIIGKTEATKDELKASIQKMGGKLGTKIHDHIAAIISTEKEVQRMGSRMEEAKAKGLQVMTEDFLQHVKEHEQTIEYIKTKSICDWGTDVSIFWHKNSGWENYVLCSFCKAGSTIAQGRDE